MGKTINGFVLENDEKVYRAIYGSSVSKGKMLGGLLNDKGLTDPDKIEDIDLLAEYDRLGGFITKDGNKVKNGCFYDKLKGGAAADPVVGSDPA
jgi:hypothetical protein